MKKLLYFLLIIIFVGFLGFQYFNNWYNSTIFKGNPEQEGQVLSLVVAEGETFMVTV